MGCCAMHPINVNSDNGTIEVWKDVGNTVNRVSRCFGRRHS